MSKSRVGPPLVIGHRGACGYRPELTRASFELAIELGADAIETDLVPTRDGILVCRHDAELSLTTDVANHARFANRRTTRLIDGKPESGWFVDDFMWEEIQALRAVERWPFRDHSFDGEFPILGLTELLALIRKHSASLTVLLELKHPAYFASAGLPIEDLLLRELHAAQADAADSPVIVESFEVSILHTLHEHSRLRLIQLIDDAATQPFDFIAAGDARTYRDLITPAGLKAIADYAIGIGVWKRLIVPAEQPDADAPKNQPARLLPPGTLVSDAHAAGLQIHAWTFRNEPQFLAEDYGGDPRREYQQFLGLGVDGLITDFPDMARSQISNLKS